MKVHFVIIACMVTTCHLYSQSENPKYDSVMARSLGADDYGMKSYVFVILKTGPAVIQDEEKERNLFNGHMKSIQRLAKEGKLVVSGPFGQNDEAFRGLFIMNVRSMEEAESLLQNDPAIREKVFVTELYEWYGSAALGEYLKIHEKIEKKSF